MNSITANTQFSMCPPLNGLNKGVATSPLTGTGANAMQQEINNAITAIMDSLKLFYPDAVIFGQPQIFLYRNDLFAAGQENSVTVVIWFYDNPLDIAEWRLT